MSNEYILDSFLFKSMKRVILIGAAGRDFHNYNVFFRGNKQYNVVAFTAAQIPFIEKRVYPKKIAGKDIPIFPEEDLEKIIKKFKPDVCVLSYSDLSYDEVMHLASRVIACGCDFWMLGPDSTMLTSKKRVVAVCGVRTGVGKSPLTRWVCGQLQKANKKFAVVRHPMPYGKFTAVERFKTIDDLNGHTIEEMEEFEPLIKMGVTVFAGVDYEKILRAAEKEADIIVWDGGNNDFSFIKPDLMITVADAKRPGHEISYYPGEVNLRMADVIVINKASEKEGVEVIKKNVQKFNPRALVFEADLEIRGDMIVGKALAVEDGPSITHGGLSKGAAEILTEKQGAELVDPRTTAVGSIKEIYQKYPHIGKVLPAMGYSKKQIKDLEETINKTEFDTLVIGTPVDLARFIKTKNRVVKVSYEIKIKEEEKLRKLLIQ